ncbi:MAG: class I SAM-dependent methyltransferase [Candidatus Bathyarchaeota archaeon]|nr:class I SAM-dependent methyltransferase [Candidatus Bathyarchaeota archaeon]
MTTETGVLGRIGPFLNYKFKNQFFWNHYYNQIEHAKIKERVNCTPQIAAEITCSLKQNQIRIKPYVIDVEDYRHYLNQANYSQYIHYYKAGKAPNFPEKSLEHYIAAKLLNLNQGDVYVDIANGESPTPEIYRSIYGCDSYRQDLIYPDGLHGKTIGGDACNLPTADGFFSKIGMHCSFEHFEHDADIRFIKEANRVLRSHGRLCIVPLYLFREYAIQTNPVCIPKGFDFEMEARLFCVRQWQVYHSRFYDVPRLLERVQSNLGNLDLTIYEVANAKDVDPSCYVQFAAVLEKK